MIFPGWFYMRSENKWKGSRSSKTPTLQRALHNAFSPSLSLFLSRFREMGKQQSFARALDRTRVGWKRAEIAMPARGFDSWRIFTAMELLPGCLDILRDILRHIRARSLSRYTRDYSHCLVRGLHWSLLLHTDTYVWRIISSVPRKRKNPHEIFIHGLLYPHPPPLTLLLSLFRSRWYYW